MKSTIDMISLNITKEEEQRFHSQVARDLPDKCWEWKGSKLGGYGRMRVWRDGRHISLKTHRLAFFLHWGVDPQAFDICHECDNPPCCNPSCLFVGTPAVNMADRDAKGRQAKGDRHYSHRHPDWVSRGNTRDRVKLSDEQKTEICRLRESQGVLRRELATMYGVSVARVDRILRIGA